MTDFIVNANHIWNLVDNGQKFRLTYSEGPSPWRQEHDAESHADLPISYPHMTRSTRKHILRSLLLSYPKTCAHPSFGMTPTF